MDNSVRVGKGTTISENANLYKCHVGDECKIHSYVYIEGGVKIGNGCKIKPFVFIPEGVTIGNDVFIGMGVVFTNDKYPKTKGDWKLIETIVEDNVSIGANSTILPGVRIGKNSMIGAGSLITKDVPENSLVYGSPARVVKSLDE